MFRPWLVLPCAVGIGCGPIAAVPLDLPPTTTVTASGEDSGTDASDSGGVEPCVNLRDCFSDPAIVSLPLVPTALLAGDVDGDGRTDLVVRGLLGDGSRGHALLLGADRGALQVGPARADGGDAAVLIDVDRDGRADLVTSGQGELVARSGASALEAIWSSAIAAYEYASLREFRLADPATVAVIGEARSAGAHVLLQLAPGPFATTVQVTAYPGVQVTSDGLDVADVDGDGTDDVVVVVRPQGSSPQADIHVWPHGGADFGATWFGGAGHQQAVADLFGDGSADVLVSEFFGALHRYEVTGPGQLSEVDGWDLASAAVIAIGDVSRDGVDDVLLTGHADPFAFPSIDLLSDWDTGIHHEVMEVDDEPTAVVVVDLDDDGHLDVVGAHAAGATLSVRYGGA